MGLALLLSATGAVTAGSGTSVVGLARSDNTGLRQPAPLDAELTTEQIEALVRRAVEEAGGLQSVIRRDAAWIAIKVNIVEVRLPGSGVITDSRVVRAVVKLAHEAAPSARISIVEGPGEWITPDVPGAAETGASVEDGWAVAGYRALLTDPELAGIRLNLVDLNVDEAVLTQVPEPWYARQEYWVPKTVLTCDALIDVPVLKIIQAVGMTCAMKNFVGIAPGSKYGWPKLGGPQGPGLPHTTSVLDETIVDLTSLARPAFTVVDAVVGMERAKTDRHGGLPVRLNTVIAGADVVAVDATCARLIGLNPDDVEYLTLAAAKGLGQIEADRIQIKGQSLAEVGRRLEKSPTGDVWQEMGHYGQGNRTWLLLGPLSARDFSADEIDVATVRPRPGEKGWSGPVSFGDDRIDLDKYYDGPTDCVVYAYTEMTVAKEAPAELWLGSDEGLAVWLDGKEVNRFDGARRHKLPNDRVPVLLTAGRHRLLVKAGQGRGRYAFSLNVCTPEPDPRYEGNRLTGLRFVIPGGRTGGYARVTGDEGGAPSSAARVLEGARWVVNPSTLVGALEGGLRAMGDSTRSTAWLTGVTGFAFRLAVSDSLAWTDPGIDGLVPDLEVALHQCEGAGYRLEVVSGSEGDPDSRDRMASIWERVVREIDRGRPAILRRWGTFLIRGYDPRRTDYLLSTWDGDQQIPFDEIASDDGSFVAIFFGEPVKVNPIAAERASLEFAVAQAHLGDTDGGRISNGLQAYRRWAQALQAGTMTDPWAHAYHVTLLHGARVLAAEYLEDLAGRAAEPAAAHLRRAGEQYSREAEILADLDRRFGFAALGNPQRVKGVEERGEGAAMILQALAVEEQAIAEIEQALAR
jgi:uncharacterized protein (DUF362 family)